jgi:hypothetical protein
MGICARTHTQEKSEGLNHSGPILKNLEINNERLDCKIGVACVYKQRRWSEGIWLVQFMYLHKMEQQNLLQLL